MGVRENGRHWLINDGRPRKTEKDDKQEKERMMTQEKSSEAIRHPLAELIKRRGSVVIDGAMSTALEALGADLNDPLWSAKVLIEAPQLIETVHRQYFEAGADVAITASYQASVPGFARRGIDAQGAAALMKLSVFLAQAARESVLQNAPQRRGDLLVAGSVGPYGAFLADGSEYTGGYTLEKKALAAFHEPRIAALSEAGADLLAVETQPRMDEIRVVLELAQAYGMSAWVTMTLSEKGTLPDGTDLTAAAREIGAHPCVDALGFNCVKQQWAASALEKLRLGTDKPLIVYPNSGEIYDPETKTWRPADHDPSCAWSNYVPKWLGVGAKLIGGCCRTLPKDILEISKLLKHDGAR